MRLHNKTTRAAMCRAEQQDGMMALNKQVWLANWKKYGLPYCSIYLISPDNHWPCKVGISANPRNRVVQLQVSCWKALKVDLSVYCQTRAEAKKIESAVHAELASDGKQLNGEWFDIRATEARDLLLFKSDVLGIDVMDTVPEGPILDDVEASLKYYLGGSAAMKLYGLNAIDNHSQED